MNARKSRSHCCAEDIKKPEKFAAYLFYKLPVPDFDPEQVCDEVGKLLCLYEKI
jgi:hypothetical protein